MSKVLVVSHYFDPEPLPKAGELARALAQRGHDVRVVTGSPTYPAGRLHDGHRIGVRRRAHDRGVSITRTFEIPYHGPSAVGRLANYGSTAASLSLGWQRGWAPDAVYVWSPPPTTIFPAHLLARSGRGYLRRAGAPGARRPRIVMDIQDLWPDFGILAGVLEESWKVDLLRRIEVASYRAADSLIVPTDGYREAIMAKGIDGGDIEVLPNWIPDEDAVPPDPAAVAAARTAEGWDDRFVVLFAGNLGNAQGLDVVVEAAARSDDPDVLWAFAGNGTDLDRLAALAESLGLAGRVQFLGRRDPATMPVLAGAADALLVHLRPSPVADVVTPTKINGYLAYGRPILCALGGEGARLVRRADAGIVVPPGDPDAMAAGAHALRALDDQTRQAMGARGRAFARTHLIRSSLLGSYEDALGIADPNAPTGTRPAADTSRPHDPGSTRGRMLVTGATGSIGPRVVDAARRAGWTVRVLVRGAPSFPDDVEVFVGDLTDEDSVRRAVDDCDVVVHLAGVAHRKGPEADAAHGTITRDGARTVFAQAEGAGCRRVVFASSIAVYGAEGCFDESTPIRPASAYAAAKAAAEGDLLSRHAPDGEPLGVVLRLATCYGPGAAGNVTSMIEALRRRRFVVVGSGSNRKSLLHVDDAAAAIVLVAGDPRAAGQIYDVSDGNPRALRDIVAEIADALGRPRPPRIPAAPLKVAVTAAARGAAAVGRSAPADPAVVDTLLADIAVPATRIQDDLGFAPRYDLSAGLRTCVGEGRAR